MSVYLAMVASAAAHRLRHGVATALQRDEAGGLVEWMVLAIVAVAVMVAIRAGMLDLAGRIITFIGDQLGI